MRNSRCLVSVGVLLVIVGVSAALVGCSSSPKRRSATGGITGAGITGADPLALREDLSDFGDYYSAMVAGATSQIAANAKDRRIRELALLFKIRSIPRMRAVLIGPDPRESLLRAWLIVSQTQYQLTDGSMKDAFGSEQAYAQDTAQKLENAIVDLAYRHFPKQAVDSTRAEIDEFAATTPLGPDLSASDDIALLDATNPGPLGILLIPLKPLSGVSDTAESLAQLAVVAQSATQVAKEMPQMIRWQTEMLLMELDDMQTTTTLRNELSNLSNEFGELSQTAQSMPTQLREQMEQFLKDSQDSTQQLTATLREARAVTDGLQETMTAAERVSASVRETSATAAQTADAWRATADAATRTVDALKELQGEGGPGEADTVSLEDLTTLAEQVRTTVESARQLLTELREPVPPDAGIQKLVDDAVRRTSAEMTGVLNGFLWRGIVLIAVGFCAVLALRFVPKKTVVRS